MSPAQIWPIDSLMIHRTGYFKFNWILNLKLYLPPQLLITNSGPVHYSAGPIYDLSLLAIGRHYLFQEKLLTGIAIHDHHCSQKLVFNRNHRPTCIYCRVKFKISRVGWTGQVLLLVAEFNWFAFNRDRPDLYLHQIWHQSFELHQVLKCLGHGMRLQSKLFHIRYIVSLIRWDHDYISWHRLPDSF